MHHLSKRLEILSPLPIWFPAKVLNWTSGRGEKKKQAPGSFFPPGLLGSRVRGYLIAFSKSSCWFFWDNTQWSLLYSSDVSTSTCALPPFTYSTCSTYVRTHMCESQVREMGCLWGYVLCVCNHCPPPPQVELVYFWEWVTGFCTQVLRVWIDLKALKFLLLKLKVLKIFFAHLSCGVRVLVLSEALPPFRRQPSGRRKHAPPSPALPAPHPRSQTPKRCVGGLCCVLSTFVLCGCVLCVICRCGVSLLSSAWLSMQLCWCTSGVALWFGHYEGIWGASPVQYYLWFWKIPKFELVRHYTWLVEARICGNLCCVSQWLKPPANSPTLEGGLIS